MPSHQPSIDPTAGLLNPLEASQLRERVLALADPADQALSQTLKSHVPYIEEVSRYIIFSGGKRLRPVLYLLCAQALGHQAQPRQAAIFEYLHAASLLHDDVIDQAGLRRGRPAARTVYGNAEVILVGDFLFSKAYDLAAELGLADYTRALTQCTTRMAEGQVLELLHTDDLDLSPEGYREVIEAKTAVLIAASCQMGGIAAGAPAEVSEALRVYGLELGLAFQMVDDALDYVGTQHEFGKPVGHDLAEGKVTLPLIHVLATAPESTRASLAELVQTARTEPAAAAQAQELVRAGGGVEHTMAQAAAHAANAQAALARVPGLGPDGDVLLSLCPYLLTRRH